MSCGNYPYTNKDGHCEEERLFATICRNCLGYVGEDCVGNKITHFCNGDCEFNSINGTCLLKSQSKVLDF